MQDEGIALYRRFLDGDEQALEALISLYRRGLLRFIYGYVHDDALAEDLLQETFVALYFKRTFKERGDASFKTYLYKVARNKSLNALKKRKRKKEVSLEAITDDAPAQESELQAFVYGADAHETIEEKERRQAVQRALLRLKAEYREVIVLRYFDDLSPERIAQITKRKTKQVYNLLARGKTALKEELKTEGIGYENG